MKFGTYFAQLRRERSITLRGFCRDHGFEPGNLSKIERGRLQAPTKDRLSEYTAALGLDEGSDEWLTLHDLAYAERGHIPPDLLSDEQVAPLLPRLFRSLRGETPDEETLHLLVERIRKE